MKSHDLYLDVDGVIKTVNYDEIAVLQESNWATILSFRGNVSNYESM